MHKVAFLLSRSGTGANGTCHDPSAAALYDWFPGVAERGAFSAHFVRDLGCAFLVAALSFLWAVKADARGQSAVIASAGFLLLQALVHGGEAAAGAHPMTGRLLAADLALVYAPTALAVWAALRLGRGARRTIG